MELAFLASINVTDADSRFRSWYCVLPLTYTAFPVFEIDHAVSDAAFFFSRAVYLPPRKYTAFAFGVVVHKY